MRHKSVQILKIQFPDGENIILAQLYTKKRKKSSKIGNSLIWRIVFSPYSPIQRMGSFIVEYIPLTVRGRMTIIMALVVPKINMNGEGSCNLYMRRPSRSFLQ